MGSTVNNLSPRSMNWRRLLSSSLTAVIFLFGCTLYSTASQKRTTDSLLIRLIDHLPEYSPNFYNSYTGISFQKIKISSWAASVAKVASENKNTANQNINNLLFSIETLSQIKMLKPAYNHIENLSVKTEGKENNLINNLCNQIKKVSMIDPIINLFNKNYLTPFSITSVSKYNYLISDSISQTGDTLYWISFEPKPESTINGFIGKALTNLKSNTFLRIIAQSAQNNENDFNLEINQNFELVNGVTLPSETKISAYLGKENVEIQKIKNNGRNRNLAIEIVTTVYQQEINPPLKPKDFESLVQPNDSAVKVFLQNKQLKMIRMMAEGKVSLGSVDLNYNRLFGYNLYEGIKLGLEGESNSKISKYFTVGGYFAYGLKDQSIRHGEWINFYPSGQSGFKVHLGYKDRNIEYGEPEFLENQSLLNPESFRNLLIKNMYSTKRFTTGIEYRTSRELNFFLFTDQSENSACHNSPFLLVHPFNPISLARTGLQVNYSPRRKFQTEDGQQKETASPKSDYYLTMIQGIAAYNNQNTYTKIEFKGKFYLPFSKMGNTTIMLRAGLMTSDAPIIEYFNGYASFAGNFSLAAHYSFATMQLNEFAATRFAAVHLRHDFSHWMFPENFEKRPVMVFAQNIGFGQLDEKYKTLFRFKDYDKGYYESGIEINNLLRVGVIAWGAGIYYRYGPYRLNSTHENFAYKFGFLIKM